MSHGISKEPKQGGTEKDGMKKYLKEIELSGILLLFIGCIIHYAGKTQWAVGVILIGIGLWVLQLVIKAFNWQTYRRDNMVNIAIMLGAIVALFISMILMK